MPAEALEPYKGKCIVMWTSYVSNQLFEVNWRKLETTLQNKHVDATKIDGADPEMKAVRSALWEISGKREYPLVFVWSDASDNFDCIGGADEIQLVSARTLFILPFYSAILLTAAHCVRVPNAQLLDCGGFNDKLGAWVSP